MKRTMRLGDEPMAGLLDLPNQIDAAIHGIVLFGHRTVSTWLKAWVRPLRGPLRLFSCPKSAISSRTLLFIASAVFVTSGGGSNLILPLEAASGAGIDKVGSYLLAVILCFLIADGAGHCIGLCVSPAGRRR